jgi:HD-like signal output (HDOD) protein
MTGRLAMIDASNAEALLKGVFIPASPAVLTELMAELRRPMTNGKRVAALINRDPGLAAGVLKSANSPLFGSARGLDSVADAIRLLGFATLEGLVLENLLRTAIRCHDSSLERFWDTAAHTAAVSAQLAGTIGGTRAETAYTFGLLHDCGIPLLVQRFAHYKDVLKATNAASTRCFTHVEDDAVQTNHAVIGCILARAWGLPATVSDAVLCHHDYAVLHGEAGLADESCALVAINVLAEHIAGIHLRRQQDAEWGKARDAVAYYSGLSATELGDLIDDLVYRLDRQRNEAA